MLLRTGNIFIKDNRNQIVQHKNNTKYIVYGETQQWQHQAVRLLSVTRCRVSFSPQLRKYNTTRCFVLKVVRRTYGSGWAGKRQTQQHQQRDELISSLYIRHGEVAVIATEAHHRRGKDICQLQEVQRHQGGQDNGELDGNVSTHMLIYNP